jgi:uncharacterized membrane protein YidH (DUF202 family)
MTWFEKIVVFVGLVGTLFKLLYIPGPLFSFSLLLLSIYYFLFSFIILNDIRFKNTFKKEAYKSISKQRIIGSVFIGIGIAILIFGILFNVLIIPGPLLFIGTLYTMLSLFLFSILADEKNDAYRRIMVRMSVPLIFGFCLIVFPISNYRNEKKYMEKSQYLDNNQSNLEEQN